MSKKERGRQTVPLRTYPFDMEMVRLESGKNVGMPYQPTAIPKVRRK